MPLRPDAQVAELVDALVSGASGRDTVKVQVLSWAPLSDSSVGRGVLSRDFDENRLDVV